MHKYPTLREKGKVKEMKICNYNHAGDRLHSELRENLESGILLNEYPEARQRAHAGSREEDIAMIRGASLNEKGKLESAKLGRIRGQRGKGQAKWSRKRY